STPPRRPAPTLSPYTTLFRSPKPKPKPKPKPVKKVQEQPKRDVPPAEPRAASPFDNNAAARPTSSTATAANARPVASVASGPREIGRATSELQSRFDLVCRLL